MSAYKLNEEELKNVIGGEGRWACKAPSQAEVERAEQKWATLDNEYQIQIATLDVARDRADVERLMQTLKSSESDLITMSRIYGRVAPAPTQVIWTKDTTVPVAQPVAQPAQR